MKIAVLDDDITALQLIQEAIQGGDNLLGKPECQFFTEGIKMLAAVKAEPFDCLILDRQVPDMSGDVILQWVRQYGTRRFGSYTSIIMLTHLRSEYDELYGLQAGADDYLFKPFKPSILLQRIHRLQSMRQTILETIQSSAPALPQAGSTVTGMVSTKSNVFKLFGYSFDSFKRKVTLPSGESVVLTRIDFDLASYLFEQASIKLSRETISKRVWQSQENVGRTLDTHIHRLRILLKLTPDHGLDLRTIYGYGYCLCISDQINMS